MRKTYLIHIEGFYYRVKACIEIIEQCDDLGEIIDIKDIKLHGFLSVNFFSLLSSIQSNVCNFVPNPRNHNIVKKCFHAQIIHFCSQLVIGALLDLDFQTIMVGNK